MATVAAGLLLSLLGTAISAPVSTYDQRQQGELNIHAQLDNIVIVLIPTSNFNLLNLAGKTKYQGDKADFLQIFQKPHKNNIDRYETVVEGDRTEDNVVKAEVTVPVVTSSASPLQGQREEEVVDEIIATVQEMKPERVIDPPKLEVAEESPVKEHSTVSETVQESVLKISAPVELKEEVKTADNQAEQKDSVTSTAQEEIKSSQEVIDSTADKTVNTKLIVPFQKIEKEVKESSIEKKPNNPALETSTIDEPTIKDLIKPVAEKEVKPPADPLKKADDPIAPSALKKNPDPVRLVEGVRKEKVIRYKPETKWAPGLVDLLGPSRTKPKDLEERRFASLCSPGTWDFELKTCIMPGETRSRAELARFLEAMRFGIAIPAN